MAIGKKNIVIFFVLIASVFSASSIQAQPSPPQLIAPSDGTTGQPTEITFEWSSVSNADRYQIQVATDSTFAGSSIIYSNNTTSTSITVDGFAHNITYYWRVRSGQDDLLGGTTYGSWSEVFNFTTVEAPPPAPNLSSPANGASSVPIPTTLDWEPANRANTYQVQVAQNSDFSSPAVDSSGISSTQADISDLQHETTYYWRVRGTNEGGSGDWSEVRSFTTVEAPPPAPALTSPENGTSDIATSPNLDWESANRADTYNLQVAQTNNFSSTTVDSTGLTSTETNTSGLQHGTTYYWRIRGNNNGGWGDWSEVYSFTTVETPPSAPPLTSPENGSSGISLSPTLNWGSAERADTYHAQVAQNSDFSSQVIDSSSISSTQVDISGLQHSTTYYWRVRGTNEGGSGDWSEVYNFTTAKEIPTRVQLVSPDSGATGVSTKPRLDWAPTDRAEYYDFQLATDQNFNNKEINLNNVSSTHYDANLKGFSTYYWRVRAENNSGAGSWSHVWKFTTEQTGNPISIESPTQGALWKAGETSTIRWNSTNNIENVTIEYKLSSQNKWSVITESTDADSGLYSWDIPNTNLSSTQTLIRISDTKNSDINATSIPFTIYPTELKLKYSYSFNSASSSSDYKLIGLPAKTGVHIGDLIPGESGSDWNAYFDNGNQKNYMVEYDNSDRFKMQPGRAFFVISKNEVSISEEAQSVQLKTDTTYAIPLQHGWNMIANPFGITIPWENIQHQNNISSTLWKFEGKFSESTKLKPFKGYYFFNQDSLDKLLIPYQPKSQSKEKTTLSHNHRKSLTLTLDKHGTSKSSIHLGFDPKLPQDKSNYQFAPPGNFQDYKLTIKSNKFSGRQAHLSEAFYAPTETKQTFPLKLKTKSGKAVTINTNGIKNFTRYEIMLIDQQTSKSYDLKQKQELHITADQATRSFLLVIGTSTEIAKIRASQTPRKMTLAQNYPNPFNGQTVIEYSIPKRMGHTRVNLDVYDILGRKVYTLVNEQKQPGFYQIRWNGDSKTGRSLASGVYYYRLKIGTRVLTKELTIIK